VEIPGAEFSGLKIHVSAVDSALAITKISKLLQGVVRVTSRYPFGFHFEGSGCFHFGTQPRVTQHHPRAPTEGGNQLSASIGCSWVMLNAKCGGLKIHVSAVDAALATTHISNSR
jgi:hypothetical protein